MTDRLTIALAQANPTVGAIGLNTDQARDWRARGAAAGADLVILPELFLSGYPPEDLVLKTAFQAEVRRAVEALAAETADRGPALLLGAPWRDDRGLFNAAILLADGAIADIRYKVLLPNYGVFDEKRVFEPGPEPTPMMFKGVSLGVMICEDMWGPTVSRSLAEAGADILISLNGSPFEVDKPGQRRRFATDRIRETGLPKIYVNQVGGQDELIFDGCSFVKDETGTARAQASAFTEDFLLTRWLRTATGWSCADEPLTPRPDGLESIYLALCLGLKDYVNKNGFPGIVLGLSGGIDSALSAAVAVDALGPDRVHAVMMPSPYTSQESLDDAAACAELLGTRLDSVPIEPAMQAFNQTLAPLFEGRAPDITEENIQSRTRGLILMALSNKFGPMLLTTGNKSEMSVGYATLYGDMCGGYSVLKDVYKTTVFALCQWRNGHKPAGLLGPDGPVMPQRVIDKPPSAELKPDQKDEDSLPPYDVLDAILMGLVEGEQSVDDLVAAGYDRDTVRRVWRLLDRAEYKRRQAPPGVKITSRAFGKDRRYPITNGFTNLI
ncbi:MAG: NAD+ synthase [Magnetospiraceae bacterium]